MTSMIFRLITAFLMLATFAPGAIAETYATYANTPWTLIHPSPNHQFVIQEVLRPISHPTTDTISGLSMNLRAYNRGLESDDLFMACVFVEPPTGTTSIPSLGAGTLMPYIAFQKPSTILQIPPFFFPTPYHLRPGNSLYLVAQILYTGDKAEGIGPLTCAGIAFWPEEE